MYDDELYKGYQEYKISEPETNYVDDMKKEKKEKGGAGKVFKNIILAMSLGLLFGICAGAGAYGVMEATGFREELMNAAKNTGTIDFIPGAVTEGAIVDAKPTNINNITLVESDISKVVENTMPAMVSIINNYTESYQGFFGHTYEQDLSASGSGIIVSENDGELLIVTNYHVIESATTLEVTFVDGSTSQAKVKGEDSDMDLAVIAVNKSDVEESTMDAIVVATLGDSDNLKLGEGVIAIGNALGYGQSVTNGIVSALNREIQTENGITGTFIQTNAAINPGNSGGALLNMQGEVIGINSNKIGGSTIEGMGYAIPITSANPIIADLLERQTKEKVDEAEMGYLGISLQVVTADVARMYNMPTGIYVYETEEGSAAQNAGIKSGDIIVKFDGQKISSYEDLVDTLEYYRAGETTKITVSRLIDGEYQEIELEITLGRRK